MRRVATFLAYTLLPLALIAASSAQSGASGTPEAQVRQWAVSATASSEGADTKARQATGPPNTESCGLRPTAWGQAVKLHLGAPKHWIELMYATPVHAVRVRARETHQPGSIFQVDLKDSSGALHTVWKGSDNTSCLGWFEVEIPRTSYLVGGVKLHTKKLGIEQIDAVELVGEVQASFSLSGAPSGAQVFWDGKLLGAAASDGSFSAIVLPGSHHVRLTATGFDDWSQDVTLQSDARANLEARMSRPTADLILVTQPGQVQVYLGDEPRGLTSAEGRLVLKALAPGSYRLRLSLLGYVEWTQTVDLSGGSKTVEAKLQPAGPKPLALAEIEEGLKSGLSNAKLAGMVKQYGVDFALTDEVEQRLRADGADGDLLLAIAKGKK